MILAMILFENFSNAVLIVLCGIVLLFLLKSIRVGDKLWVASVASAILIVIISVVQIVSYNNLAKQIEQKEAVLDTLRCEYAKLKSETEAAQPRYIEAKEAVSMSRQEFQDLQNKVTAEFERTIQEIRKVYANISDEELNRRVNNAVRRARFNLQNSVFQ